MGLKGWGLIGDLKLKTDPLVCVVRRASCVVRRASCVAASRAVRHANPDLYPDLYPDFQLDFQLDFVHHTCASFVRHICASHLSITLVASHFLCGFLHGLCSLEKKVTGQNLAFFSSLTHAKIGQFKSFWVWY